ncbi:hypothetical protein ABW20_dc0108917 [Dactylellina cionopaga]|nr:hypothetical protein ABW20_dc0108917 [Dactylellina cionopaga]
MSSSTPAPFQATCLCRANTILIPSSLPRTAHICHCTTCRTSHGTLFAIHTDLESLPFSPSSLPATLKTGKFATERGQTFFCSTCGTWMFASYFYTLEGKLVEGCCVSTGCLSLSPEYLSANPSAKLEDVLSVDFHCLIKDTIDGGAAPWVGDWSKESQMHFFGKWEEPPMPAQKDATALLEKHEYPTGGKELDGWCKCKDVKVRITRDDEATKYKTSICVCDSCRLSTGTDIVPYTRTPRDRCFFVRKSEDGEETVIEWPEVWDEAAKAKLDNLIIYESTPGKVVWGACGGCGARIFYHRYGKKENGKQLVEPMTALFGADDTKGILHLDWLEWEAGAEGAWLMDDAEKAGRAGIVSRNAAEKYNEWVEKVASKQAR